MSKEEETTAVGNNKVWWEWKKIADKKGAETYRLAPLNISYVRLVDAK